ncbi:MAG: hypothetical protein LBC88_07545 [Spirochaetaceae bacterium]|jgi:hypothetical protein|nr:hypothetical protein [Spirochaetaceae bacterium]
MRRAFFFLAIVLAGCSRRAVPDTGLPAAGLPETAVPAAGDGWPSPEKLVALVRPGPAPLWFETGPGGPARIASPEAATLAPWTPWTQAFFVAEILPDGDRLVMAVNRDGFFLWVPAGGAGEEAGLYRIDLQKAWDTLTVAALVPAGEGTAALLYRDTVFGVESGGPFFHQFQVLDRRAFTVRPLDVRAFTDAGNGREVKALYRGRDGFWYFRAERDGEETGYFRFAHFSSSPEPVQFGVFRNAMTPYTIEEAPYPFDTALQAAAALARSGESPLARVVFAGDAAEIRRYAAGDGAAPVELAGFFAGGISGSGMSGETTGAVYGAVCYPGGRGVYLGGGPEGISAREFSLPVLPEGFAYTRLALAGRRTVIAAWEEQENWNIAAAGFMVMTMPDGEMVPGGNGREKE